MDNLSLTLLNFNFIMKRSFVFVVIDMILSCNDTYINSVVNKNLGPDCLMYREKAIYSA